MNDVSIRSIKCDDDFFEINNDIAGVVPMACLSEQIALNKDIEINGQREAIVLWKNKVVDGRCRMSAIKTMGINKILYKRLDDNLTEDEVKTFVKSVNTRRNLTQTQKIIVACKESLKPGSKRIADIAEAWGISRQTLKNARYIAREKPEFIEPLFDGKSVRITNQHGKEIDSNKITAIYSYIKRVKENAVEDSSHGWRDDSRIKTQAGKEWYYLQLKNAGVTNDSVGLKDSALRSALSELANYKFNIKIQN